MFFYVGIPTLEEKATQLIKALRLAADANPGTQPPATRSNEAQPPATQATIPTTPSSNRTSIRPPRHVHCGLAGGDCVRTKRQTSTINYCPEPHEQANNRICPNMCDKDRPRRPIGVSCSKCTIHSGTPLLVGGDDVCTCMCELIIHIPNRFQITIHMYIHTYIHDVRFHNWLRKGDLDTSSQQG